MKKIAFALLHSLFLTGVWGMGPSDLNRSAGKGLEIPPNAQVNLMGNGWECSRGFRRVGNGCEKVELPANAQINLLGNGWECSRGFRRIGNSCERVELPANAQLNPMGNGWVCARGFKQVSSECKEMTLEELRVLEAREKAVLSAIAARRARLAAGNSCETESRSGAEVCLSLVNVTFDCDKSSYANHYSSCEATITYELDTNYKGRGYLDVEVECRVDIEYSGRGLASSGSDSQRKDESTSLYSNGNESETLRFDFSFSSYEQVTRASISSYKCEIDDIGLR